MHADNLNSKHKVTKQKQNTFRPQPTFSRIYKICIYFKINYFSNILQDLPKHLDPIWIMMTNLSQLNQNKQTTRNIILNRNQSNVPERNKNQTNIHKFK